MPLTYAGDVIELLDQLGDRQAIFVGTSLGGLVTMTIAATAPQRIAAAILNDVGPDVDSGRHRAHPAPTSARIARFKSWDEAADAIAGNYGASFDRYTHDDWVKMAKRNCREENGEIRFDYDMAIAEPFKTSGPDAEGRPVAVVRCARAEAAARRARREKRTADRRDSRKDARGCARR